MTEDMTTSIVNIEYWFSEPEYVTASTIGKTEFEYYEEDENIAGFKQT